MWTDQERYNLECEAVCGDFQAVLKKVIKKRSDEAMGYYSQGIMADPAEVLLKLYAKERHISRVKAAYLTAYRAAYLHQDRVYKNSDPDYVSLFVEKEGFARPSSLYEEQILIQRAGLILLIDLCLKNKSRFGPLRMLGDGKRYTMPGRAWTAAIRDAARMCFKHLSIRFTPYVEIEPLDIDFLHEFIEGGEEFVNAGAVGWHDQGDIMEKVSIWVPLLTDEDVPGCETINMLRDIIIFVKQCLELRALDNQASLFKPIGDVKVWAQVYQGLLDVEEYLRSCGK